MSKKLKEPERQQNLENFFKTKCIKDNTGKTADQLTPVPSEVTNSPSVKKRTPPSIESESNQKKLPKLRNTKMPNQVLFEEEQKKETMDSGKMDSDKQSKTALPDNAIDEEEDEELP